jgi:antitoxin YefM
VARIISFTDARARLSELLDDVEARHEHVVITRKGLPSAVVVPAEEWRAIGETLDVLRDEQTLADLRESAKDLKADRLSATVEATSGGSKLRLTRRAKNQLSALPKTTQDAVLGTLLLIQREPATIGNRLVALAWPRMAGLWAVRAGSYRVLYTIERRGVIVRAIAHGGASPSEI